MGGSSPFLSTWCVTATAGFVVLKHKWKGQDLRALGSRTATHRATESHK